MTSEQLLPPLQERATRFEILRHRLLDDPRRARVVRWLAPALITLVAAILRLWNLGHPAELAFDERYYVKDAWSLWMLGYEGRWGDNADASFAAGDTGDLSTAASFVVHPPLGKWLIALGMALFGQGSGVGWRISTALLGTATVLLVYLITLAITRSLPTASVAGGLIAIDGTAIVLSRIGLLDAILTFFIVLGFWFVLLDRVRTIPRLERRDPDASPPRWGPVLWRRPWVLAAGVALGCAASVKWSGLYALAGLGIYLVVTDALARRRAGVLFWPTDAAFRQGPVTFLLLVPVAAVTYLVSWSGWLVTSGGFDRQSSPNPFIALWNYHQQMYGFHVGLSSGHSYASAAWEWPLLLRPTAVWVGDSDGATCWGSDHCIAVISAVPNPLIWWGGFAAALYLMYRIILGWIDRAPAPWAFAVPLVGLAVTWVPWLLYPERTIFQFYTVALVPFVVLALALALREIAGSPSDPLPRRLAGQRTVWIMLAVIVAVSIYFFPIWTGMTVPYDFWRSHNWLPGWV